MGKEVRDVLGDCLVRERAEEWENAKTTEKERD